MAKKAMNRFTLTWGDDSYENSVTFAAHDENVAMMRFLRMVAGTFGGEDNPTAQPAEATEKTE